MTWLQQQISNTQRPDTILHLGAGLCSELDTWRQSGARRIILVEPNPELLPELRRRTQGLEQVKIITEAISSETGQGALRLFNFPLMNSLREPIGLNQLLPGLEQLGQATVDCLLLKQLLEQEHIDPDENNWLMIDTPGEEAEILAQLERADLLHTFSRIFLNAGVDSLYRGAQPADAMIKTAHQHGFGLAGPPDDSDADWVCQHLYLNREALKCERLRKQLAGLKQQHDAEVEQLTGENAELQQRLEDMSAKLEKQKTDVSVALKLQMLRETDLTELQQRYGKLQKTNEQQRELLGKLHQRLSAAAEYLSLSDESRAEDNSQIEDLVRALTGDEPHSD